MAIFDARYDSSRDLQGDIDIAMMRSLDGGMSWQPMQIVLDRRLKVMDLTAFTLCRENGLQIIVFDMDTPGNLGKVLAGERIGTLVKK